MLQLGHELGVEAAERIARKEARAARTQLLVECGQKRRHARAARIVAFHQKHLKPVVQVLDLLGHGRVRHEEVVSAGNGLHDVTLDLIVVEDGEAVIDEDGRLRGLKVGAEVVRRPLHVHRRDLEADGLELGEQVQVHKVLLAKDARALSPAVDSRGLDDELDLGHGVAAPHAAVLHGERSLTRRRSRDGSIRAHEGGRDQNFFMQS